MPIDSLYLANLLQVHTPTVQCYTKLCCRVSLRMALKKNVMVVFFVSRCITVCAALAIVCPCSSFYTFLLLFRYSQTKYFSSVALIS